MICLWEGCEAEVDRESINEHIEGHAKGAIELRCMWKGCSRNGELFNNRNALTVHARAHSGNKPFKCSKCQKDFSRADALNKHIKRHEEESKQVEGVVSRLLTAYEERGAAEYNASELLDERQFYTDCMRLLSDELLRGKAREEEKSWDEYL